MNIRVITNTRGRANPTNLLSFIRMPLTIFRRTNVKSALCFNLNSKHFAEYQSFVLDKRALPKMASTPRMIANQMQIGTIIFISKVSVPFDIALMMQMQVSSIAGKPNTKVKKIVKKLIALLIELICFSLLSGARI